MGAGAVDQDKIIVRFQHGHRRREALIVDVFTRLQGFRVDFRQVVVTWPRQIEAGLFREAFAVGDIAAEALLAQVEIERAHLVAHAAERGCNMHRQGGFARAALFVSDNDDMCHFAGP